MLSRAIHIATKAHEGQFDKSRMPYVGHVMRVMEAGWTMEEKVVGVLHDIVEDTDWTFERLEQEGFPKYIVDAIRSLTKTSEDEPYDDFIERVMTNTLATRVKINDLTDNMDIRRLKEIGPNDVERLRKYLKAYRTLTASK
jgi:(p)ppGpp synthase/HD superfamily hydrolase